MKRGKGRGRRYSWDGGSGESDGGDRSLGWWRAVNNKNGRPLLGGATQHNATHICCAFGEGEARPPVRCVHTHLAESEAKEGGQQPMQSLRTNLVKLLFVILFTS